MEQKFDVKNSKEVIVLVLKGGKVLKEAKANDGKIDFNDAGLLFTLVPMIGPAVEDIHLIPSEMKDLSVEEATELIALVASETGEIVSPELQVKIEKALKLVHAAYDFAKAL